MASKVADEGLLDQLALADVKARQDELSNHSRLINSELRTNSSLCFAAYRSEKIQTFLESLALKLTSLNPVP